MLNTKDLQNKIIELKKENDVCILAHAYQSHDILEVADFVGDSFGLAKEAKDAPQGTILMCGVRFMAETVKILSPEKKVILSHSDAGCPMAEQLSTTELKELKKEFPNASVVAYVNTTAALKCESDVCVTSASAIDLVKGLENDEILFIPDPNLGNFVKKNVPNKKYHFINGGCPVHKQIKKEDVFSIVNSSFMPYGIESDQYSVLGEIKELQELENSITNEKLYSMQIESNDLNFRVVINKNDLLGEPAVGRRFKGSIWMQGTVSL